MKLKVMNTREKKRLADQLSREYGVGRDIFGGCELLGVGGDVWVTTRHCLEQNLRGLKVDSVGLQAVRDNTPTIHGIQLLFNSAEMTELTLEEAREFIKSRKPGGEGRIVSYRKHPLALI